MDKALILSLVVPVSSEVFNAATCGGRDIMGGMMAGGTTIFDLFSLLGYLILTVVLVAFFTPQLGLISGQVEKTPVKSFLWGILAPIAFILFGLVLLVSIIGIVLIPLWILLFVLACLFGNIGVSHLVGKKVLYALRLKGKTMMTETIAGTLLLFIISLMPVIGGIIVCLLALAGLGAAVITRCGCEGKYGCCCK
jgi:hypothetical protein